MSELRVDPITGRRVIVVPGRIARPNEYAVPPPPAPSAEGCPFCEGSEARTPPEVAALGPPGRAANASGWWVRVIPNRFPTVDAETSNPVRSVSPGELSSRPGYGYHEVVIESPTHSPMLPFLPPEQVDRVLRVCRERVRVLSERPDIGSVTVFENVGPDSGGSLWHPHSQLVATPGLSPDLVEEFEGAERYRHESGAPCAFEELARREVEGGRRLLFRTEELTAYTPFASTFPLEVRFVPSRHVSSFGEVNDRELERLAERVPEVLRALLAIAPPASYNLVSRSPVPSMGDRARQYHWHLDLYPRLVRPDGFDIGSGFHVNTARPEDAAEAYREALGRKR